MACWFYLGGATLGATASASIIACNTALGNCQAACAALLFGTDSVKCKVYVEIYQSLSSGCKS